MFGQPYRAWWPLAFGALALGLRIPRIGARSFWNDEAFSAWLAARPVSEILAYVDYHPPLYYLILKAWTVLGPFAASDAGLRLPSALASAGGVALSVWLIHRLQLPGAGLVGLLGATAPVSVWYAQEARMYALAGFFVLAGAAALALLARRGACCFGPTDLALWGTYSVSVLLGALTHYGTLPLLGAATLAYLVVARPRGRHVAAWLSAIAVAAILYLPHAGRLFETLGRASDLDLTTRATTLGGASAAALLVLSATALVLLAPRLPGRLAVLAPIVVLIALGALELTPLGSSVKRHVSIALPLLVLLAGVRLATLAPSRAALTVAVLAAVPGLFLVLFVHPKEDWRGAASVLVRQADPTATLLLHESYVSIALGRYYSPVGPTVGVGSLADYRAVEPNLPADRPLWLVESHTDDPPTLAPYVAERRPTGELWELYRVRLQRFGPVADVAGSQ